MTTPQNPRVTQEDRTKAERFNCDLRCGMTGTQVNNLAAAFARHREAAEAASKAREAVLVEALGKARRLGDEVADALTSRAHGLRDPDEHARLMAWDKFSFGEFRALTKEPEA